MHVYFGPLAAGTVTATTGGPLGIVAGILSFGFQFFEISWKCRGHPEMCVSCRRDARLRNKNFLVGGLLRILKSKLVVL